MTNDDNITLLMAAIARRNPTVPPWFSVALAAREFGQAAGGDMAKLARCAAYTTLAGHYLGTDNALRAVARRIIVALHDDDYSDPLYPGRLMVYIFPALAAWIGGGEPSPELRYELEPDSSVPFTEEGRTIFGWSDVLAFWRAYEDSTIWGDAASREVNRLRWLADARDAYGLGGGEHVRALAAAADRLRSNGSLTTEDVTALSTPEALSVIGPLLPCGHRIREYLMVTELINQRSTLT